MLFDDEVEFEDKLGNNNEEGSGSGDVKKSKEFVSGIDKLGHKRNVSNLTDVANTGVVGTNPEEYKMRQTTSDMISMNDLGAAADGKSADN